MPETQAYDTIIIGSGQAGGPLSTAMVRAGRKAVLLECEHVGGTCINVGCTPTKTMIASGEVAYLIRRAREYGVDTAGLFIDMKAVRRRKREVVNDFRSGSIEKIREGGVDVIIGEACFVSPKDVAVDLVGGNRLILTGKTIVINTGARPARPPVPGLESVPVLTSTSVMELDEVPGNLVILGGGYIGVEFGQLFRRLGSSVTIIQRGPALLAKEDPDIAEEVANLLRDDGIEILLSAETKAVRPNGAGVRLTVEVDGFQTEITGSHLLLAAGRAPNTEGLNLSEAGVKTDERGFIQTDERLRTAAPDVYAVGDVVSGRPAFTHISYEDFRILRANLLEGGRRTTNDHPVPYTLFTDPQLGRVGLTERQARGQGRNIKVGRIPMAHVARAIELDRTRGHFKAIVDADNGQILGCAALGYEGGELMAMIEIAMMGKLPYTAIRDGVWAHPTLAESLNTVFSSIE